MAEVLHAPELSGIWTLISRSCKANPMPAGGFSLGAVTKPGVMQPGHAPPALPPRNGMMEDVGLCACFGELTCHLGSAPVPFGK